MVLRGNPQEVTTNVCEVGKAIKANFNGDNGKMFSALTKEGGGEFRWEGKEWRIVSVGLFQVFRVG